MARLATRQEERKFRRKLASYLEERHGRMYRPGAPGGAGRDAGARGAFVGMPEQDIPHLFDNEAMLAVSHAIEDLASETGEGELVSTFQQLKNFRPHKKRYLGLARDLDTVRVWGEGLVPRGCPRIDFIPLRHPELRRYWMVLFSSRKARAVLVCRQVNEATDFREKIFYGLYSFDPLRVESIRRRFQRTGTGLDGLVAQWEREFARTVLEWGQIRELFRRDGRDRGISG